MNRTLLILIEEIIFRIRQQVIKFFICFFVCLFINEWIILLSHTSHSISWTCSQTQTKWFIPNSVFGSRNQWACPKILPSILYRLIHELIVLLSHVFSVNQLNQFTNSVWPIHSQIVFWFKYSVSCKTLRVRHVQSIWFYDLLICWLVKCLNQMFKSFILILWTGSTESLECIKRAIPRVYNGDLGMGSCDMASKM